MASWNGHSCEVFRQPCERGDYRIDEAEAIHSETKTRHVVYQALQAPYGRYVLDDFAFWLAICNDRVPFGTPAARTLPAGIYRHFKGNHYLVMGSASHAASGEEFILYRPLYGNAPCMIRPFAMFTDHVERPEIPYAGPRFTLVAPR